MTYHPKSEFMAVMMQRGFLADCTDYQGLDEALSIGVTPAYIGLMPRQNHCMLAA